MRGGIRQSSHCDDDDGDDDDDNDDDEDCNDDVDEKVEGIRPRAKNEGGGDRRSAQWPSVIIIIIIIIIINCRRKEVDHGRRGEWTFGRRHVIVLVNTLPKYSSNPPAVASTITYSPTRPLEAAFSVGGGVGGGCEGK